MNYLEKLEVLHLSGVVPNIPLGLCVAAAIGGTAQRVNGSSNLTKRCGYILLCVTAQRSRDKRA